MTFPRIAGARLSWAAVQHAERPALIHGDRILSFSDVEARTNRFAHALLGLGLAPGERIAVLLNNCADSVITLFGAEKAAQTFVALNARHTVPEHAGILNDAQVSTRCWGRSSPAWPPSSRPWCRPCGMSWPSAARPPVP